jgi:RimJ/RimL family protein N-acetyltransferase
MILLETSRLRLRRFTLDDADLLVELDSDPEVMRYITFGAPTPREAYVNTYMPRWFEIYAQYPLLGYWAAARWWRTASSAQARSRFRHARWWATLRRST